MAKLGIVIDDWMEDNDLDATAIQCWNSLQQNYGVNVCTLMSMMSEKLMPSACEVGHHRRGLDVRAAAGLGRAGRHGRLGTTTTATIPDKCVLFHCGNWRSDFYTEVEMKTAEILGTTLGRENICGAVTGRAPAGPADLCAHQHR